MEKLRSLRMGGDGDDVEMLEEIEKSFDMKVSNAEAEKIETVGDLFDLVIKHIGDPDTPQSCYSAHTFYELRKALLARGYCDISLNTPIRSLTDVGDKKELWAYLESQTSFNLPARNIGFIFALLILFSLIALISLAFGTGWIGVTATAIGITFCLFAHRYTRRRIPYSPQDDLRKLTQDIAKLNFGSLAKKLGGYRESEAWRIFTEIISDHTDQDPLAIGRNTVFFDSQLKKQAR